MRVAAPVPVTSWSAGDAHWEFLGQRSSGATVYRVVDSGGPRYYVKTTPHRRHDDHRFNPVWDAERLTWLAGQGLPVPEVVTVGADEHLAWIVTTALPGSPAAGPWTPEQRWRVIDIFADVARTLHALPVAECPFRRRLTELVRLAEAAVEIGAVDLDDIDAAHAGWTAQQLWDQLRRTPVPPKDDLVVCHGDLCLGNVLIDPQTLILTGIIDVDRVGVADRWHDLSLALYNIGGDDLWGYGQAYADRFLRRYGLDAIDHRKVTYYQLLDEFL